MSDRYLPEEREAATHTPLALNLLPSRKTLACLADPQALYILAELTTPDDRRRTAAELPLNLSLLIDRSTSMKGERLTQVKAGVSRLIDALGEMDTLSIVTFSDRAEVVLPSQRPVSKLEAKGKISAIRASGGTEVFRGLMYGLAELYKGRETRGINHLILLTDGRTYGDEEDCLALAAEAAPDGISISALGIGHEWNDDFLDRLAGVTGGSSIYVEAEDQIVRFLDEHVRALDAAFAHDLRVQVKPQPGVELKSIFKLTPSPQPLTPDRDIFHVGALSHGQSMDLLLEFVVQPLPEGYHHLFDIHVSAQLPMEDGGQNTEEELSPIPHPPSIVQLVSDFAAPVVLSPPRETPPARIVAALGQLSLYAMHERSLHDVEQGQTVRATRRLQALASRLDHLGQTTLAHAARTEADRLQQTGMLSEQGRKRLKYGTRALIATAPRKAAA